MVNGHTTTIEALQSTSLLRGKTRPEALGQDAGRFNPLPSCEGRPYFPFTVFNENASIHFPLAREDAMSPPQIPLAARFNPLPSCEGRLARLIPPSKVRCFNPLPSCEGRRSQTTSLLMTACFNPLPSCEGRRGKNSNAYHQCSASIHFPLAREDQMYRRYMELNHGFNPLPSCEGRRPECLPSELLNMLQSTSLLRGKTIRESGAVFHINASIHFPLAREDEMSLRKFALTVMLQSTSLLRGKTVTADVT